MSFITNFGTDISSFRVNPKYDKYLFNTFDPILLIQYNEILRPEIEIEDKKNIENPGL